MESAPGKGQPAIDLVKYYHAMLVRRACACVPRMLLRVKPRSYLPITFTTDAENETKTTKRGLKTKIRKTGVTPVHLVLAGGGSCAEDRDGFLECRGGGRRKVVRLAQSRDRRGHSKLLASRPHLSERAQWRSSDPRPPPVVPRHEDSGADEGQWRCQRRCHWPAVRSTGRQHAPLEIPAGSCHSLPALKLKQHKRITGLPISPFTHYFRMLAWLKAASIPFFLSQNATPLDCG